MLAIDDVHMEFDSLTRVRKALERFLWEDLRPEDQVALVTTSGASALSQEFTSDRAVLRQTLSRLSAQGRRADWNSTPRLSEYQAEQIENGDPLALEAAVQEVLHEGIIQGADTAADMSRHKARVVLNEAVANSRLTLEALESLCRGLGGITGRKALFLVSDGFLTGLSARSGVGFDLRRIADAGTRAGVVVYALDTRGLVAAPPGVAPSSPARVITTTFGNVEAMRQRSLEATRDALHALAADTGGFLAENSNNLRAGLRELLKDTETYYVLAYEPTNTKRDGGFRRIEVRVPGVSGLKLRTRSGYFAADDRRAAGTTEAGAEAAARRTEQRQSEMRTALLSLAPLAGIPVRLSADFVVLDGAQGRVVVSASLDVSGLPFVQRENRRQATLEAAGLVYGESGQLVSRLDEERLAVDVGDEDYAQLRRRGLPYRREVALAPGRYQVRVAARDDATGLLGSAWRRVEVPDLALGQLALSGLFLMKEDSPAASGGDATPTLRNVQELPRFAPGERLYVQLQAYNAKRDASGAVALSSQAAVLKGGAVLATAAPEPMVPGDASGPIAHVSRIGLRPFEPGDYELRVTVTDRNASATATRSVAFTVE